jgi:hypothetical protein
MAPRTIKSSTSTKFDRTYAALVKKHYRKNAKAREEFEQIIADYKQDLRMKT